MYGNLFYNKISSHNLAWNTFQNIFLISYEYLGLMKCLCVNIRRVSNTDFILVLVGDQCQIRNFKGICTEASKCTDLPYTMSQLGLKRRDIQRCGFTVFDEIICCP